ncbi:hypothetical protein HBA54_04870 [Pelagibius litoralis]|uniref:Uncharacterized protein n=1 Tax=Pelagibius litoralis TaxID=374515 RepID=A0A967CAV0_9PROT|nr:hypothetical protein [Pelagibius litoralis]NIA67918.1 hypothetical protein [Pelagibius litoralis]
MHKSISTILSRRRVLAGVAVAPVAALPVTASASPEGVSPRIGKLFQEWRKVWAGYGDACDTDDISIMDDYCAASFAAFQALLQEPSVTLMDIAAKAHALRIQMDGCCLEERDIGPIYQDIDRLAIFPEEG